MAGTIRISRPEVSPSTTFTLQADELTVTGQNITDNETVVRCYVRAVNDGDSTSRYDGSGSQVGSIDGVGTFRTHSGNPFLPSGVPAGQRWEDGPYDVTVPHDADGTKTVTLRMTLNYGSISRNLTAELTLTTLPRVPYAFLRWDGAAEVHAVTAVRWDGAAEVPLTVAVRWDGTKEVSLL